MHTNKLRQLLAHWTDWVTSRHPQPRPLYAHEIHPSFAQVYIGVRRCGKTTVACDNHFDTASTTLYINFEDPFFILNHEIDILDELIRVYVAEHHHEPTTIIFDEIHHIPNWERWIRKMVDLKRYQICLTGSSAKLLSSEIATSLTGRSLTTVVWPLSFSEFIAFSQQPTTDNEYLARLDTYMQSGGFPDVVLTTNQHLKIEILRQYLQDILYRDIVTRHEIRHTLHLNQIVQYYLKNISYLHSASKIKKAFNINIQTVQHYTQFLEDAFLIFSMSRYHPNLKVQARDPKKIYCIDPGLRNANVILQTQNIGALAENIVYLELRRRTKQLYYFQGTQEVDFICVDGLTPTAAIQVSYCDFEDDLTLQRERGAMLECLDQLGLDDGLILTRDTLFSETHGTKTINFLPLFKWLQSPPISH